MKLIIRRLELILKIETLASLLIRHFMENIVIHLT